MSANIVPTSFIPSQPSLPTLASIPLTPTLNDPTSIPTEFVTAPVTKSVLEPVTTPVNAYVPELVIAPITAPGPHTSVSHPTQSLSIPTPVCPSVPQVASMFQVPSITNTHSMVTRSKVGTFKPKALVAQAISD